MKLPQMLVKYGHKGSVRSILVALDVDSELPPEAPGAAPWILLEENQVGKLTLLRDEAGPEQFTLDCEAAYQMPLKLEEFRMLWQTALPLTMPLLRDWGAWEDHILEIYVCIALANYSLDLPPDTTWH
jgi:hypothetical protein